ncbi:zinc ribbon domain-containing protein [Corallococcus sp. bb12-1]|uniref:zinc ribbon domain-containing protein n=1 Tax=Corallococcus sp. bb12-1 TaxID=2996784 RepID=UPI0022722615|nr:zinc ribbon domain-containing protein [Corallococcus sp. bb12-1]MCY1044781.1 zinc ribbon domain-containing protein [Corallococcus sp. bb12-1]
MQCPECGESAADVRLMYCEQCGAKMPARPATAPRPSARNSRPSRPASEPAYASELMEEEEEDRRQRTGTHRPPAAAAAPVAAVEEDDGYTGPRWLKEVPGHSQSVLGVGVVVFCLALSILPFFPNVGVVGSLLTLVGGVAVVARELRRSGDAPGWVDSVPLVLMRPEVPAAYTLLLAALALKLSGFNLLLPIWVAGAVLVGLEQYKQVVEGPDGVNRLFDVRSLLGFPRVLALAGVAVCLIALYLPWGKMMADGSSLPANVPVPASVQGAPPELRVIPSNRPDEDSLYAGGGVITRSGWDVPASELPLLALLSLLVIAALHPEVERPAALRWVPLGAVSVSLLWALAGVRLAVGPFAFLFGLGAVGFYAVRHALARDEPGSGFPPEEGPYDDEPYDPEQDSETERDTGYSR